jgi:hypothetical protein
VDALRKVEETIGHTESAARHVLELSGDLSRRQADLDAAFESLFAAARKQAGATGAFADLNQVATGKVA